MNFTTLSTGSSKYANIQVTYQDITLESGLMDDHEAIRAAMDMVSVAQELLYGAGEADAANECDTVLAEVTLYE